MAVWFSDDFTNNGTDELLNSHTPSIAGDGYALDGIVGTSTLKAWASLDECSISASGNNAGVWYYIEPRAKDGGADQNIDINYTGADTAGDEVVGIAWRAVGSGATWKLLDDSWMLILGPTTVGGLELFSVVSGIATLRDNAATTEIASDGALVEIETTGNAHVVYFTGTGFTGREKVLDSGEVAVNTAAGDILVGSGANPDNSGRDHGTAWDFNSITVDGTGPAAGGGRIMSSLVNAGGLAALGGIAGQGGGLAN